MAAASTPDQRNSAWASLLKQQVVAPARPAPVPPSTLDRRPDLMERSRSDCQGARQRMAAAVARADTGSTQGSSLREWVSCLDAILAVAEQLHLFLEERPIAA